MSGQTYSTQIRIPTPQELAMRAATAARDQELAGATGFAGVQSLASLAQLRGHTLRFVTATAGQIGRPIAGTVCDLGPAAAEVEMSIAGARVPVRVQVDPDRPDAATVSLDFSAAHGLSCADESRIAADFAALFAAAVSHTPDVGGGGAVSARTRSAR